MTSGNDFVLDASGSFDCSDGDSSDIEVPKFTLNAFKKYSTSHEIDQSGVVDSYINVYPEAPQTQFQKKAIKDALKKADEKNIVGKPGFETLEQVPTFLSRRQSAKIRMKEKEKTKGFHWFDMRAANLEDEQKNDLLVLQMRQALDPKHFYKRSVQNTKSKFFEVGTYVEAPVDFYSSRIPKKQRKKNLVEELMADVKFRKYQKKKMEEVLKSQPRKKFQRRPKRKSYNKKKS